MGRALPVMDETSSTMRFLLSFSSEPSSYLLLDFRPTRLAPLDLADTSIMPANRCIVLNIHSRIDFLGERAKTSLVFQRQPRIPIERGKFTMSSSSAAPS